jgi:hypothetical protein
MLPRSLLAVASVAALIWPRLRANADKKDGSLVIGVARFPASLNPYMSSQTGQFCTIGFATRRISAFDVNGKIVCLLCTELLAPENGRCVVHDAASAGFRELLTNLSSQFDQRLVRF